MTKKNKILLWINAGFALLAVFVSAISTAAWFQLDSQAPEATITTKDPNLTIDDRNVTGYKVNHVLGSDGFINKTDTTVTSKKGQTYDTSNNNQATADPNFDVPEKGLGYYLVKKNPSGTYKYKYNGTPYATKFNELNNSGINYLSLSITTSSSDSFIIRNYSYNTGTYSTVNEQVKVTKDTGDFTISEITYEIIPSSEDSATYTVWFNKSTKKITFESSVNLTTLNKKSARAKPAATNNGPKKAAGATADSNSLYLLYDSSQWWFNDMNSSSYLYAYFWNGSTNGWGKFNDSGYKYNDKTIYKASVNFTPIHFIMCRLKSDSGSWGNNDSNVHNKSGNISYDSSKTYCTISSGNTFNWSAFSSVIYDGWIMIGKSGTGSSTFGSGDFTVADAKRLESSSDENLGQISLTLNPGDSFKIAYLKNGSPEQWEGANKLEVYYNGSSSSELSVVQNFFVNMNSEANCVVRSDIDSFQCTIYFTKNGKKINVNPSTTVNVMASKFNFSGSSEGSTVASGSTVVTFGSSVTKATINGLSLTIPSGYTRDGDDIYSDVACTSSLGNSFYANSNPMTVYIKVKENAITIYLQPYFSNTSSGADGTADTTKQITCNSQFGVNSTVTASALKTIWNDTYTDNLTYNGIKYTYSRIESSSHTSALASDTQTSGTIIYVRYVRVSYTITLTPSYFEPTGTNQLNYSIQSNQTQSILDGNSFSTSNTFANCEYKDHTNGVWYVFARSGSSWYSDAACTTVYSGTPTAAMTLYAKMVAYPLTTLYIDADYPGWDNCYIHMWGSLSGLTSAMGDSLTCKAVTTDSGNKLYRVSIPTESITSFLFHAGNDGNQTADIAISSLTNSSSKYCYLAGDTVGARTATFTEYKSTLDTGVYVRKWNTSTSDWDNKAQLLHGDGVGNDYILESGLQLSAGDIIQVYDTNTSTAYGYNMYITGNLTKHPYIATGQSGNGITLSNFTNTARFNFYITHNAIEGKKLSIAMVPDYGNGYYIMDYNTSLSTYTEHYINAIKMDSNEYNAIYTGYYSEGGASHRIFIKSYLNAVDTLCASLTSTSSSYATMTNGVITFNASGYYTIQVTNSTVDISRYSVTDFFKLNSIDTTSSDTSAKIYAQRTSLILEVPFTSNNPYTSNITLLTGCNVNYIGVNLYVTSSPLGTGTTIYDTLRGESSPNNIYTGLTAANMTTPITDKNNCAITAKSGATYYAYILIDYMPGVTLENITGAAPEFKLYLQSNQI